MRNSIRFATVLVFLATIFCACAQMTVTGTISGTVQDASGQVVPAA